jgi:hypothetical protein
VVHPLQTERGLELDAELAGRRFAYVRCQRVSRDGRLCHAAGYPTARPAALLAAESDTSLAYLYCDRCVLLWRILQVEPAVRTMEARGGTGFRRHGCRERVPVPAGWKLRGPMTLSP